MLADSEGELLEHEPVYCDGPSQSTCIEEESQSHVKLREAPRQLEEANQIIASTAAKDEQTVAELQKAQHECELQATQTSNRQRKQLAAEEERTRTTWRTRCKHLAKQDAVIMGHKEEIILLRQWIAELETPFTRERDSHRNPPPKAALVRPAVPLVASNRDPTGVAPQPYSPPEMPLTATTAMPKHDSHESNQLDVPSTGTMPDHTS